GGGAGVFGRGLGGLGGVGGFLFFFFLSGFSCSRGACLPPRNPSASPGRRDRVLLGRRGGMGPRDGRVACDRFDPFPFRPPRSRSRLRDRRRIGDRRWPLFLLLRVSGRTVTRERRAAQGGGVCGEGAR